MFQALLQGRHIFKFGLLRKKDNKKNLKIRLVFNRMVVAFFLPTILIPTVLHHAKKTNVQIGTFGFRPHTIKTQKTKRAYFLLTLGQTNKETNEMYIEKRDI